MTAEPNESRASLTHFDADVLAAALEEPTLTVGRFRYRGRVLAMMEWLPYWERELELQTRAKLVADQAAGVRLLADRLTLARDYLRAVFPRRRYTFWAPDPVKALAATPGRALEEAFARFFIHQATVLGLTTTGPSTSGSGSGDRTAADPAPTPGPG